MPDRNVEYAQRWIAKAENDLVTAEQTLKLADGPTDTPCFHAQQAIEKALKALLTFHEISFPKTHDLMPLMDKAISFVPALEQHRAVFAEMTDYGVQIRYPSDWFEPARTDAESALAIAQEVVETIKKALPKEKGPN